MSVIDIVSRESLHYHLWDNCKMRFFVLLLVYLAVIPKCDPYKILIVVPGISNSQMLLNYRLGDLLGSRGHNVTLYVAHLYPNLDIKRKAKFANTLHYVASTDFADLKAAFDEHMFEEMSTIDTVTKGVPVFTKWFRLFETACEKQITDKELMAKLADEKFDLAIGHMYDLCPLGIFRALKIPTHIWMSSGILMDYMAWYAGVPSPASFVPNGLSAFSDKMKLSERLKNFLGVVIFHSVYRFISVNPYTALFRKHFGDDFPSMPELMAKAPLIFVNSEELIDFPRPILHKIIYIGGIDVTKPEPLNNEWQEIMDNSKKGVVFFSFGSVVNASAMPLTWKKSFLEAFSRFPDYTFIWKFDTPLPEAATVKNVKLTKWAPQKDLLAHPKMKAFITHCGFNSLLEAANNGVPLLALPIFGDQMGNFKRAERHGIAVGLSRKNISADAISQGLQTILTNSNYSISAKRLSGMLKKKPVKAEDLAVGWVEFLAEHKEIPNFQPISAELSFVQYFLLDVAVILLLQLFVFLFVTWIIAQCVLHRCRRKDAARRRRTKSKRE